jgi:pimeloyl-ACP methyl ester carboxylesterase
MPGRRVIALDLPGHGRSPGGGERSVAAYAQRVLALLDELGVDAALVLGHSMGGAIALTLALEARARVAGLALVGTGARLRVSRAVLEATASPALPAQAARDMAVWSFGPGVGDELLGDFADGLRAVAPGVLHGDFLACDAFDVMGRLGEVSAPTLVLCGTEDRLTPPKYSEYLHRNIRGARLELIAGAGHMVMLEAPAQVAAAVRAAV